MAVERMPLSEWIAERTKRTQAYKNACRDSEEALQRYQTRPTPEHRVELTRAIKLLDEFYLACCELDHIESDPDS